MKMTGRMGNHGRKRLRPNGTVLLGLILIVISGCASRGPEELAEDRYHLTEGIARTLVREALLNVVRLRYDDWPTFIEVKEVYLSRRWEDRVVVGAEIQDPRFEGDSNRYEIGIRSRYSYRPKIVYQPLSGKQYTDTVITPVPPEAILTLVASGYPADRVLQNFLESVNGFPNTFVNESTGHWASDEFVEFTRLMRVAQFRNALELRRPQTADGVYLELSIIGSKLDPATLEDWDSLRDRLGLNKDKEGYRVVFGGASFDPDVLALHTRSIMQYARSLAIHVDVPPDHVSTGITQGTRWLPSETDSVEHTGGFGVSSGNEAPEDAYVSVPYQGSWFWIDDTDIRSRTDLQNLLFLANITESGRPSGTRFVIPVN